MKLIHFLILSLLTSISYGQKSAKIVFEDNTKMLITENMPSFLTNLIKSGRLDKNEQYEFMQIDNESLFKYLENDDVIDTFEDPGVSIINVSSNDDSYYWKNIQKDSLVMLNSLDDKKYKIVDKLPKINWELENKKEKILGYDVLSAVSRDTFLFGNPEVRVWFALSLPISNGPFLLGGLPGMILKVELLTKSSHRIIEAKSIELNKEETIVIPKVKYKKVISHDEFRAKKKAMMKKYEKMRNFSK